MQSPFNRDQKRANQRQRPAPLSGASLRQTLLLGAGLLLSIVTPGCAIRLNLQHQPDLQQFGGQLLNDIRNEVHHYLAYADGWERGFRATAEESHPETTATNEESFWRKGFDHGINAATRQTNTQLAAGAEPHIDAEHKPRLPSQRAIFFMGIALHQRSTGDECPLFDYSHRQTTEQQPAVSLSVQTSPPVLRPNADPLPRFPASPGRTPANAVAAAAGACPETFPPASAAELKTQTAIWRSGRPGEETVPQMNPLRTAGSRTVQQPDRDGGPAGPSTCAGSVLPQTEPPVLLRAVPAAAAAKLPPIVRLKQGSQAP